MNDAAPQTNQPPDEATILRDNLAEKFKPELARLGELLVGFDKIPAEITADDVAARANDFIAKQVRPFALGWEKKRTETKTPYDTLAATVQTFFKSRATTISTKIAEIEKRLGAYATKKRQAAERAAAEAERKRQEAIRLADEEARRKTEEAAKLSKKADTSEERLAAAKAQHVAQAATTTAAEIAKAPAPKPEVDARVRGDFGSTLARRETWKWTVVDPGIIPRGYLTIDDAAVRQAIQEGVRDIPGLKIEREESYTARSTSRTPEGAS